MAGHPMVFSGQGIKFRPFLGALFPAVTAPGMKRANPWADPGDLAYLQKELRRGLLGLMTLWGWQRATPGYRDGQDLYTGRPVTRFPPYAPGNITPIRSHRWRDHAQIVGNEKIGQA